MSEQQTRRVAKTWFDALDQGDFATAMSCLADDVVWVNLPKVAGVSDVIPWLGTRNGKADVALSFQIRDKVSEVKAFQPLKLMIDGDEAFGTIHDHSQVLATGRTFDIEFATWFKVEDDKITQWKSYCDPSPIIAAFRGAADTELVKAVLDDDLGDARRFLAGGADVNARNADTGQSVLMIAACHARPDMVKVLLDAGADVHALDSQTGASALHKACQGGGVHVVRLLVEAGAFVDLPAPTTGHTPVMDALWYKWPEVVDYLLAQGADVNLSTHYGFTLWDHLAFETKVNVIDSEKMGTIKHLFDAKKSADAEAEAGQPLMAAVQRGDVKAVKVLIRQGADVNAVYPRVNSFQDGHTPLLVAARDGHQDIVPELLAAAADVRVVDWVFKGSPIHKATYNGNPSILAMLIAHPDIDINVQGPINGYTPLHDALWHGFTECASMLLDAGARLDLRGHDGKTPLDVATDVYGSGGIVDRIRATMGAS
ncbi:MAG: ankyrin repeat domain-containing protein [Pseudonocardiaceae bacterium]